MRAMCLAISAVLSLAQAPPQTNVRVLEGLPEDVATRVTMSDSAVVYGVRNDGVWQLVARTVAPDGTGGPVVLVTAPPGFALMSPALAPDGRVYFESNVRTPAIAGRDDSDVWVMERSASGWEKPAPIGAPFATEYRAFAHRRRSRVLSASIRRDRADSGATTSTAARAPARTNRAWLPPSARRHRMQRRGSPPTGTCSCSRRTGPVAPEAGISTCHARYLGNGRSRATSAARSTRPAMRRGSRCQGRATSCCSTASILAPQRGESR